MAHGSQAANDLTYGSPGSMLLGKSQVKSIRIGRFASREQTQESAALELKCKGEQASTGRKASACCETTRSRSPMKSYQLVGTRKYLQNEFIQEPTQRQPFPPLQ